MDGRPVGETPLEPLPLSAGTHTVRVEHPRPQDWLERDWERSVDLAAGETVLVEVRFPGVVWVASDPQGAAVFADGALANPTPAVAALDPDSVRDVILLSPGYRELRFSAAAPVPSVIFGKLKPVPDAPGGARRGPGKGWIIGSAVVAAVSGILGYYFRWRADRAYEAYRHDVLPESMNRHFEDAVSFDRLSGWCYGTGEISLGVSLTLFIHRFSVR